MHESTLRLHTISFVCEQRDIFRNASILKTFIMDQHAFGGLSDAEVTYLFTKYKLAAS